MKEYKSEFKYKIGEKVRRNSNDEVGEVVEKNHTLTTVDGYFKTEEHYFVQFGNMKTWLKVDQLSPQYVFDDEFEAGLCDLMIDTNLLEGNLDLAEAHFQDKQRYKN